MCNINHPKFPCKICAKNFHDKDEPSVAPSVPTMLSLGNGDTKTNPYDIANVFNNYFASIAGTTKTKHKVFSF